MNSSPDNAKFVDKSPSAKDNVAISSTALHELEISDRLYEDLSLEFQRLYPYAVRAFELIPLMYNRLTLVDKLSHKDAFTKICDDHKHLFGFSQRNIRRHLPSNNPITPRRVRPSCPKNSSSKINEPVELSIAQRESSSSVKIDDEVSRTAANPQLQEEYRNQIAQSESDLKFEALVLQNKELREAVKRQTAIVTADQIPATEIQFTIPKEKYPQLTAAIDSSRNSVYLTFDKSGILERAESDIFRGKLHNV